MRNNILKNLSNSIGWRTNRKIVVFESDDWGSIRMPSLKAYQTALDLGINVSNGDGARYNMNDTLESPEDFEQLYSLLLSFQDINGNHPKITAVSNVANPNFEKIRENDFNYYYSEPISDTYKRYNLDQSYSMFLEGINHNIFLPQFHGREHLNINAWIRALKSGDKEALNAFNLGFWGYENIHKNNLNFQAAFDLEYFEDIEIQKESIIEGLQIFEQLFNFRATFFVPPNGPINNTLESTLKENGINYISTSKIQKEVYGEGKTKKQFNYLGKKSKYGQTYLTRNCNFEPSDKSKNWIDSCLYDINNAFKWRKPAIICSHRVNYVSGLNDKNRVNGLKELNELFKQILNKWPNTEFMFSNELGEIINGKN